MGVREILGIRHDGMRRRNDAGEGSPPGIRDTNHCLHGANMERYGHMSSEFA